MQKFLHLFIINPAAGASDQTEYYRKIIEQVCTSHHLDYKILVTAYPLHAISLIRNEAAQSTKPLRLYACGGDGTLNEVARSAVEFNLPVAHFPGGSGNDFIKLFSSDVSSFSNLEHLLFGQEIPLDYIQSNHGIALNILSVGADADVAYRMQKYKRLPLLHGSSAYIAAIVETFFRGFNASYSITVDGVSYDGDYALICIANGRWYGGSFCPVPDAAANDGLLDILLVKKLSRFRAAGAIKRYQQGRYHELPHLISHLQGTSFSVASPVDKKFTANLDGEIVQTASIDGKLMNKQFRFILPRGL